MTSASHAPSAGLKRTVLSMDHILENSFRDFHAKGFDYICLKRERAATRKLYFFDGDVCKLPEVINPHDHRYDFTTLVLAGTSQNKIFAEDEAGETYTRFDYRTPLNGGNGFTYAGETKLREIGVFSYRPYDAYFMAAHELHTIRMLENETVLMLVQGEDLVPMDQATSTFTHDREPPALTGLYSRFTADQVIARLRRLQDRTGIDFLKDID